MKHSRATGDDGALVDTGATKSSGSPKTKKRSRTIWNAPDRTTRVEDDSLLGLGEEPYPFVTLHPLEVQQCFRLLDTECTLKNVADIVCSELLSGGVEIYRNGFRLTQQAREFYSTTWAHFVRRLLRSLWATGIAFVATEPHPTYRAIPHVLEMTQLHVRFYTDRFGLRHYVVTDPALSVAHTARGSGETHRAPGWMDPLSQPLPGLRVFEMDPPRADGHVQSKVQSLLPFIAMQYDQLSTNSDILDQHKHPHVFIGDDPHYTKMQSTNPLPISRPPLDPTRAEVDPTQFTNVDHFADQRSRMRVLRDAMGMGGTRRLGDRFHGHDSQARFSFHRLDAGLTTTFAPLPEQSQNLDALLTLVEERVGSSFGVPRSMFSRSQGTYRTVNAEASSQMLFKDTLRALKNIVVPIMNSVFLSIYRDIFVQDALRTLILSDNIDAQELVLATNVSWNLPGSPDIDVLTRLYREGSLRREFYLNALSHKYCIPLDQFEPKELITRRELAGIPPPETGDKPPPSKNKKKTKGQSKGGQSKISALGSNVVRSPYEMAESTTQTNKA